jgi:hypothetical protein
LAAFVIAALAAALARAPDTDLELQWEAPPSCPDASAVRAAIDANLGREAFASTLSSVVARGTITAQGETWRLDVEVSWSAGRMQRSVVSDGCTELAAAAGLVIAVALDMLRDMQPEAPPQVHEEERPQPIAPPEPAPPERARKIAIEPRVGAELEIGALEVVRGGVAAGVGFVGARWRVDLVGQYWAPRSVRPFAEAPDAGVSVQQGSAGARACLRARVGPIELPTCLGAVAGGARARGIGLDVPRRALLPWAAVVLGQEVTWVSRRRVGVFVGADAMIHVVRPRFRVTDVGTAVRTSRVGARFVVGALVRVSQRRLAK